jgi:hypothetical protein
MGWALVWLLYRRDRSEDEKLKGKTKGQEQLNSSPVFKLKKKMEKNIIPFHAILRGIPVKRIAHTDKSKIKLMNANYIELNFAKILHYCRFVTNRPERSYLTRRIL